MNCRCFRPLAHAGLLFALFISAGCAKQASQGEKSSPASVAKIEKTVDDIPFTITVIDDTTSLLQMEINVEPAGDATVKAKFVVSKKSYDHLKKYLSWPQRRIGPDSKVSVSFPEPRIEDFLELQGLQRSRVVIKGIAGSFDDQQRSINISYQHLGWGRIRAGKWVRSWEGKQPWKMKESRGRCVLLEQHIEEEGGFSTLTQAKILLPEGASAIEVSESPIELRYTAPPPIQNATSKGRPILTLEKPPHLMAALYKLYGDPKQVHFWAAKAIFRNEGNEVLSDYKARFRLSRYSEWSRWERCDTVFPSQTVIHAFYPVIDPKVRELQSATPADVEVEYSYTDPNGKIVTDTHAERIRILGFHEGVLISPEAGEKSWARFTQRAGPVLASFITPTDPIILDLLGLASKRAGGVPASSDDNSALLFASALHEIIRANVAYETTGGMAVDDAHAQHLKFRRDVLRTKSGTCVNLAILYASVLEAAGLNTFITLVPGHAMPTFELPRSKRWINIEATVCGGGTLATSQDFQAAIKAGEKTVQQFLSLKLVHEVGLTMWRKNGIFPPDLPDLGPNPLTMWNVRVPQDTENQEGTAQATTTPQMTAVTGVWSMTASLKGKQISMRCSFRGDGTFTFGSNQPKPLMEGRYTCSDDVLLLQYKDGRQEKLPVAWSVTRDSFALRPAGNIDMLFRRQPIMVHSFTVLPIHNIELQGQRGMVLRLQLRVDNAAGVPVSIAAWFADKKGKWLKGKSQAFRAGKDEILYACCNGVPKYDETQFTDVELFIPYEEFQLAPGEHEVCYKMTVRRSHDQKLVFQSDDWSRVKMLVDFDSRARSR